MFMPERLRNAPDYAIAVRGLSKRFGRRVAIDDLTLSVRLGEICGLAGANGGGKSTSLRMLAGLVAPDQGEGTVLGCDLLRGARRVRHKVGYLAQRSVLYPTLSVRENLRFRAAVFGLSDPARMADLQIGAFGLTEFSAVSVGQLSGGWCRQVDLAAALIHRPRVLLLDEPTAGLDPAARQAIWRRLLSLAAQGTAIVLSTHDLNEAQYCEKILLLSDGRIRASGAPREVAAQVDALARGRSVGRRTPYRRHRVIGRTLARILAVARIETLRLLVDRPSIGLILLVPALQLVLFGYAVNLTPKNIPIAIAPSCDAQRDLMRRAVADTGSFTLIPADHEPHLATQYISSGRALVAVDCSSGQIPRLAADASDPSAVRPAVALLETALLGDALRSVVPEAQPRSEVQWLYNPDARTAWSLAPGLVGVVVMITMLMLGALTLVRDREQGSWEGLLATPVTALDALLGKLAPYVIVAVAQAAIVIGLAKVLFNIPTLGNVTVLLLASALFGLAHLTLGFALSAVAHSQIQAIQAAVFFYLPSMLLSGFMFPFEGMPAWARALGNALPLTHFVRSARGVLLKGYGASEVMTQMWPVAVFALASAGVAIASYRRRLI